MQAILEDIVAEHAEEAAFLWQQREAAVRAPDYDIEEIAQADERVEAHLDGLRVAGETGWAIAKEIGWELGGEYFTAMSQAIFLGGTHRVAEILKAADGDPNAARGVISAFGWADPRHLQGLVKQLLGTRNPFGQQVGIGACAIHRVNPGPVLTTSLNSSHAGLRARSLKAVGELGLVDLLPQLQRDFEHEDDECRFWAAWSAGLLGHEPAARLLTLFAQVDNPRRRQALELAVRIMAPEASMQWLRSLAADRRQLRWALIGAGVQGDPAWLEPLMGQFGNEEVARVAGEAFQMITGLNIFRESLEVLEAVEQQPEPAEGEVPEGWDEDDEEPDLGEDLGLVVPDPEKMTAWYEANGQRFTPGRRYFCGQPLSPENCQRILREGQQRQRSGAALERVIASPGSVLFETRAPGARQLAAIMA